MEDLRLPCVQSRSWAIVIVPQSRGEVSKALTPDDTMFVDGPPWFGPLLQVLKEHRLDSDYLFPDRAVAMRREWQEVQGRWEFVALASTSSLGGGGSSDVLHRRCAMLEVMMRGRWSSESTLKRYCKAGKLGHLLSRLSAHDCECSLWCDRNLMQ